MNGIMWAFCVIGWTVSILATIALLFTPAGFGGIMLIVGMYALMIWLAPEKKRGEKNVE